MHAKEGPERGGACLRTRCVARARPRAGCRARMAGVAGPTMTSRRMHLERRIILRGIVRCARWSAGGAQAISARPHWVAGGRASYAWQRSQGLCRLPKDEKAAQLHEACFSIWIQDRAWSAILRALKAPYEPARRRLAISKMVTDRNKAHRERHSAGTQREDGARRMPSEGRGEEGDQIVASLPTRGLTIALKAALALAASRVRAGGCTS